MRYSTAKPINARPKIRYPRLTAAVPARNIVAATDTCVAIDRTGLLCIGTKILSGQRHSKEITKPAFQRARV